MMLKWIFMLLVLWELLNDDTLSRLKCSIIAGAANNPVRRRKSTW